MQKHQLSERIFEWALRYAEGFPLVKQLGILPAKKYVMYLSALPVEKAVVASRSLVKRMNEPMLFQRQPELTEAELAFVNDYRCRDGMGSRITSELERIQSDSAPRRTQEMRKVLKRILLERLAHCVVPRSTRAEPCGFKAWTSEEL